MELLGRYSNYDKHLKKVQKLLDSPPPLVDKPVQTPRPHIHKLSQRFDEAARAHMVAEYEAGSPAHDVAEMYGISKATLLMLLDDHGVEKRHRSLTEDEVDEAVRLYGSGLSLAAVGKRLVRHPSVIRNALLGRGVALRDSHGRER